MPWVGQQSTARCSHAQHDPPQSGLLVSGERIWQCPRCKQKWRISIKVEKIEEPSVFSDQRDFPPVNPHQ